LGKKTTLSENPASEKAQEGACGPKTTTQRAAALYLLMKSTLLAALITILASASLQAATVLTNNAGAPGSPQLIKGPGGFISQPISLGFEFTTSAHPDGWILLSLSLTFSSNSGPNPLSVELYSSPAGPNTATYMAQLNGPANPTAGSHTWTVPSTVTLASNSAYFVKLSVPGGPSTYGISRTADPATGDWALGSVYTQGGSPTWTASAGQRPFIALTAIPEPATGILLAASLACGFLRRRRA
jgi:hypothetical protein